MPPVDEILNAGKKVNCYQTYAITFCIEWVAYFLTSVPVYGLLT
jgi:hypothetical protein